MEKKIGISILNSDLLNIERVLNELKIIGIRNIHIDIADTSFVNNISFGPSIINRILEHDFEFDIHLMLKDPLKIIKQLEIKKDTTVNIHSEIEDINQCYSYIKEIDAKIGIAFNPTSDIKNNLDFIPERILIMTVNPGFGAQEMIESCISKIEIARKIFPGSEIAIDGGINMKTIEKVKHADYFVIGSSFFNVNLVDRPTFINSLFKKLK